MELHYTLLTDGSSDDALIFIIDWLLGELGVEVTNPRWADLRRLPQPVSGLTARIQATLELYPGGNILFVHRDAENQGVEARMREIEQAIEEATGSVAVPPYVCVVPVRMTEAWLFSDEKAIRKASGNSNGKVKLDIPRAKELETLPDPKERLFTLLKIASELKGRRLRDFGEAARRRRVAELTEDFAALRNLKAFQNFESQLKIVLENIAL
jgi:hypothetical protein